MGDACGHTGPLHSLTCTSRHLDGQTHHDRQQRQLLRDQVSPSSPFLSLPFSLPLSSLPPSLSLSSEFFFHRIFTIIPSAPASFFLPPSSFVCAGPVVDGCPTYTPTATTASSSSATSPLKYPPRPCAPLTKSFHLPPSLSVLRYFLSLLLSCLSVSFFSFSSDESVSTEAWMRS